MFQMKKDNNILKSINFKLLSQVKANPITSCDFF